MNRKSHSRQPRPVVLHRVAKRPSPDEWQDFELLSLPEAAALFWPGPDGLLTTTSLRTAVRDRQLEVAVIAGKFFTNKAAIRSMCACKLLEDPDDQPDPEAFDEGPPTTVAAFRRNLAQTAGGRAQSK
jgi:hypothetical protein